MDSSNVKARFSSAHNIDVNWIVRLEEICVSRCWPAPAYETVIDSSHGIYAEFCRIHEYCEVGVTRASAARKICWRLEAIPQEGKTIIDSSQCDLNADSTNLQLQDADDNSSISNSIAEFGGFGKVKAIRCSDSISEPGVSGEAEAMGCGDNGTSSSIPQPEISGETKAMGYWYTVKYVENSIGTLQEMCMSQRWPLPTYNIITYNGPVHARVFTIACSIMHYSVLGEGSKLKKAKKQAASKMLKRLQKTPIDSNQISDNFLCSSNEKLGSVKIEKGFSCTSRNSSTSTEDFATSGEKNVMDSAAGNDNFGSSPIGCLQEICQLRAIPLPIYKLEADVGPSHARVFTIACYVSNYTALGVASSIKSAKRLAAHKMLTRLHENNN